MNSEINGDGSSWPFLLLVCTASFILFTLKLRLRRQAHTPSDNRVISRNTSSERTIPMCVMDGDIVSAIARNVFTSSKVCITWEVLGFKDSWKEGGERAMEFLVSFPEIFLLCRVEDEFEQKKMISFLRNFGRKGLDRDRVLFCTTGTGYKAFIRQLNPVVLISYEIEEAEFLSHILPYILVVGKKKFAAANIQTIPSIMTLVERL